MNTPRRRKSQRNGGQGLDIPMAKADDMANARPTYLEQGQKSQRDDVLLVQKRPLLDANALVFNHAERVVSGARKTATEAEQRQSQRRVVSIESSSALPGKGKSRERDKTSVRKGGIVANARRRKRRKEKEDAASWGFAATRRRGSRNVENAERESKEKRRQIRSDQAHQKKKRERGSCRRFGSS